MTASKGLSGQTGPAAELNACLSVTARGRCCHDLGTGLDKGVCMIVTEIKIKGQKISNHNLCVISACIMRNHL